MPGQRHQDVDPVFFDERRDPASVLPPDISIVVKLGNQGLGGGVGAGHIAIAEHLDLRPVMTVQEEFGRRTGGVTPEVGGDVADTQAPPGIGQIIMVLPSQSQWRKAFGPLTVAPIDLPQGKRLAILGMPEIDAL